MAPFIKSVRELQVRSLRAGDIAKIIDLMISNGIVDHKLCIQIIPNLTTVIDGNLQLLSDRESFLSRAKGEKRKIEADEKDVIYKILALYLSIYKTKPEAFSKDVSLKPVAEVVSPLFADLPFETQVDVINLLMVNKSQEIHHQTKEIISGMLSSPNTKFFDKEFIKGLSKT